MELEYAELDALVRRARAGDGAAFESLWLALSPRVAAYLRSRGVKSIDDVTSEVFLGAFQGIAAFAGDGAAFRSWLFTLAHHKSVDSFRRSRPEFAYDPAIDDRRTPSAEDEAMPQFGLGSLDDAIAALPRTQREVLVLRVLGDMAVEDVARIVGRSPSAVRQLQKRAVANLRRTVTPEHVRQESFEQAVPIVLSRTIAQLS
jgi:RNA polymerase sigma-70 factor (ECF subfamily)